MNNLQPDHSDIYIGDEFVESLNDSIKIRHKFLSDLVNEIEVILNPRGTFEEWKARQKNQKDSANIIPDVPAKIPYNADAGLPKFSGQSNKDFLNLMKSYFSTEHHAQLSALINTGTPPETQLIFQGCITDSYTLFGE